MLNRSYQRARNGKLKGHQLDLVFPRRGRPSRHRALERCGQATLDFGGACLRLATQGTTTTPPIGPLQRNNAETLDDALQTCFPIRPMTEDELEREFNRLFPPDGPV